MTADRSDLSGSAPPWRPIFDFTCDRTVGPGLYVHVPFCTRICPYCDFAVQRTTDAARQRFLEALERELAAVDVATDCPPFDTVYLGGGTPSALTDDQLSELAALVEEHLPIAADAEWSLEVNPEDVDGARASRWRELGFGAVSVGLQSLRDSVLRDLGRRHRAEEGAAAVAALAGAGFSRVSFDLIYATGGTTLEEWEADLERAASLGAHHLSCYELTFHEGTPFHLQVQRGRRSPLAEDDRSAWFETTHRLLGEFGYRGYEVSNFALSEGDQSRHNRKYWRHVPYLGLGPSAHSFDGRSRWWNQRSLEGWAAALEAKGGARAGSELLDREDLLLEALSLGLRTRAGLDEADLLRRFDWSPLRDAPEVVARQVALGRVEVEGDALRPTLEGWLVADTLAVEIAP